MDSIGQGNPGSLSGTWKSSGIVPMTLTFRLGEEEAMGIISRVTFETKGKDVLVTYTDGLLKGTTIRYTMLSPDAARNELVTLRRIRW